MQIIIYYRRVTKISLISVCVCVAGEGGRMLHVGSESANVFAGAGVCSPLEKMRKFGLPWTAFRGAFTCERKKNK